MQRFHTVPGGGGRAYVEALVAIALSEQISLFVPCSGAGTTVDDAQAADLMREKSGGRIRTLIQDAELAATLHEKVRGTEPCCHQPSSWASRCAGPLHRPRARA